MNKIITIMIIAMFAFSCGGNSGRSVTAGNTDLPVAGDIIPGDGDTVPAEDIINDVVSDSAFDFSTVAPVEFEITVTGQSGEPLSSAVVTLLDDNSVEVTSSVSDENGVAEFTATVEKSEAVAALRIEHEGYTGREVKIEDIGSLEAVIRTIGLARSEDAAVKPDRDGDRIPDDSDAFPDDSGLAFISEGEFTLAFEDLYPSKGDADFNDSVVKLHLTERINSSNEVVEVLIVVIPLASGAGYRNLFGIYLNGERHVLIKDLKASFGGAWNSKRGEKPVKGTPAELLIRFEKPVPRVMMQPMPYDPFIVPNSDFSKGEVHLPSVETVYPGKRLDSDGFPWAIIVPDSWQWPYESTSINVSYPEFKEWYLSEGEVSQDWYLRPDEGNVFISPQ